MREKDRNIEKERQSDPEDKSKIDRHADRKSDRHN